MKKYEEIAGKAIKVIWSCDNLGCIPMMDNYVDLAVQQILKKKTAKNYQYAATVLTERNKKLF